MLYGEKSKKSNTNILYNLENRNDSDINDIDIVDSDAEYTEDDKSVANEIEFDSDDELPLSEIRKVIVNQQARVWYVERDNSLAGNAPAFIASLKFIYRVILLLPV
ncbi:hypothetical protein WA026_022931 [Henosepilachna vigintioctopunctata]|uniref:Uncharacterized protein n=1 Tax=Henosepilachna vigintioctopunctata TaxID=420089 RepID=A0AAW1TYT1_9CUCU